MRRCCVPTLAILMPPSGPTVAQTVAQQRRDVAVVVPEELLVWEYHALGFWAILAVCTLSAMIVGVVLWFIVRSRKPAAGRTKENENGR